MRPLPAASAVLLVAALFALSACGTTPTPTPAPTPTPVVTEGKYDVGGYSLYMKCYGSGSPSVILETGIGGTLESWARVYPDVAAQTRVCTYDRAGLGRSGSATTPRSGMQAAQDLHALLGKAGIAAPYIVVGHSLGGLHVRVFQSRWPGEVVGMVLVDSSHPDQIARSLAALPPQTANEDVALSNYRNANVSLSEGGQAYLLEETNAQVRTLGNLGTLPLAVVSQTPGVCKASLPGDLPDKLAQAWQDIQKDLAALSTNSTYTVAKLSCHMIPTEEPKTVIAAVLEVLQKARGR